MRLRGVFGWFFGVLIASQIGVGAAGAAYIKDPESDLDLSVFRIDEARHLGTKLPKDLTLVSETGADLALQSFLGKPLVMVLSYYSCDGSCSLINQELMEQLTKTKRTNVGKDFNILTLSFDRHDTRQTMAEFRAQLAHAPSPENGWTIATFKNEADIRQLTDRLGFRFFWSPRDRIFYHPGAFLVFSPDGRLARVLYALNADASDLDLAILESKGRTFTPNEIVNLAVSMCFSYNYADGKYTLNYPILIAGGSLFLGISAFSISALTFRRRRKREEFS